MKTLTNIAIAGLCASTLAACAGMQLERTPTAPSGGTTFTQGLHSGYMRLARNEYAEGDYRDSDRFALLAGRAGRGEAVDPQPVAERLPPRSTWPAMPGDAAANVESARARLMTALPEGRTRAPSEAARAQIAFDCWLQEQEENFQPDDIAACRRDFETAMTDLDTALRPAAPQPATRAAAPAATTPARTFLVFFDWDSARLTESARSVVATAARNVGQLGRVTVVTTGHADRSGPDAYNLNLSRQRAEAVKAEMVRLGIPAGDIGVSARGEAETLVPTDDGVREPQNRRVQIVLN
ncbi:MAG: OmpA family protein [Alphaproteobacteria bacterium]|nr:OmpA family protein [Alphaproteobacteria bacterium]